MKILVSIKRVEDYEAKIRVKPDGSGIETDRLKYIVNPFDDIAVEEALRLGGEVVAVTIGDENASQQLSDALAKGAARGIHILSDVSVDATVESMALAKVVAEEKPDLFIIGKQAIDDDQGQTGAMLAERLGWPLASFASKEESLDSENEKAKQTALSVENSQLRVVREVDGGLETLKMPLPAVVTTELRLNIPRYKSAIGIMKAKKKPVNKMDLSDLVDGSPNRIEIKRMTPPKPKAPGEMVADVATLIDKLKNEARVI